MKYRSGKFTKRFMSRFVAVALVLCCMYFLKKGYGGGHSVRSLTNRPAIALGSLIILAWFMGDLFQIVKLPRITAYMITGLVAGPYMLGLIEKSSVETLRFIDKFALALIALHAGHEVRLSLLRRHFKQIISITFFMLIFSFTGVFLFIFFAGQYFLPFLKGVPQKTIVLVALLFGLIEVAKSPVTTIAILDETKARGPLAETTLGVVVITDVILIALFGIIMGVGRRMAYPMAERASLVRETLWHLFGSLFVGGIMGYLVSVLIKKIRTHLYLVILSLAIFLTILGNIAKLEILLVSMTVGFIVGNFTPQGEKALQGIEKISPIVYLIFFPVASASLNLTLLKDTWFVAIIIVMLRKLMVYIGINVGSKLVEKENPHIRKYGWMGFINQSGVTLALALIIGREFPEFGKQFEAIVLGMIVITDFYSPALFKYALHKTGESGPAISIS